MPLEIIPGVTDLRNPLKGHVPHTKQLPYLIEFNADNDTSLDEVAPTTGVTNMTLVKILGSAGTPAGVVTSNQAKLTPDNSGAIIPSSIANCTLEAVMTLADPGNNRNGFIVKWQDGDNNLTVLFREPNGDVALLKRESASPTLEDSFAHTFVDGNDYDIKVVINSGTYTVFINDVEEGTLSSNYLQSNKNVGICRGVSDDGCLMDNFQVYE